MSKIVTRRPPFGGKKALVQGASRRRGRQPFNVWYHYSARLQRDVIMSSDVELDHFYWLEGDSEIEAYELQPEPSLVMVQDQVQQTQFDALVRLRGGRAQLREVKEADSPLSARFPRLGPADFL